MAHATHVQYTLPLHDFLCWLTFHSFSSMSSSVPAFCIVNILTLPSSSSPPDLVSKLLPTQLTTRWPVSGGAQKQQTGRRWRFFLSFFVVFLEYRSKKGRIQGVGLLSLKKKIKKRAREKRWEIVKILHSNINPLWARSYVHTLEHKSYRDYYLRPI